MMSNEFDTTRRRLSAIQNVSRTWSHPTCSNEQTLSTRENDPPPPPPPALPLIPATERDETNNSVQHTTNPHLHQHHSFSHSDDVSSHPAAHVDNENLSHASQIQSGTLIPSDQSTVTKPITTSFSSFHQRKQSHAAKAKYATASAAMLAEAFENGPAFYSFSSAHTNAHANANAHANSNQTTSSLIHPTNSSNISSASPSLSPSPPRITTVHSSHQTLVRPAQDRTTSEHSSFSTTHMHMHLQQTQLQPQPQPSQDQHSLHHTKSEKHTHHALHQQEHTTCLECAHRKKYAHKEKQKKKKKPWRPICYERQPYDDNYTDESFLSSLVMNANVQPTTYLALVLQSVVVCQRIAVTSIFMCIFYFLYMKTLSVATTVQMAFGTLFIGLTIFVFITIRVFDERKLYQKHHSSSISSSAASSSSSTSANVPIPAGLITPQDIQAFQMKNWTELLGSTFRRLLLFCGCLLGLSPVLKTLTHSYSSDTIWALTLFLTTVHLIVHDYQFINDAAFDPEFQGTISLNAGVFASVLLASRLYDDDPSTNGTDHKLMTSGSAEVFVFLFCAFLAHAGFPFLAHQIRRYSVKMHVTISILLFSLACGLLYLISNLLVGVYVVSSIFIAFICPAWLKWVQKYKNEIHGPWDYDDEAEWESDNL